MFDKLKLIIRDLVKRIIKNLDDIIFVSIVLLIIISILSYWYFNGLNPKIDKINEIIKKFTVEDYEIPYYIAERYLVWYNMRTFFFALNYILTLWGIIASLITVFYASTNAKREKYIVLFSLLSMSFTIANIFINAGSMSYMSQHAWRSLDSCIIQTITNKELSINDKDRVLVEKVVEIEQYIESYEH